MSRIVSRHLSVAALAAAGALALSAQAQAKTVVSTIDGCYDCGVYDTPSLTFHNTSGGTFTNAKLFLQGYQGLNNGLTASVNLGTIASGDTQYFWGSLPGVPSATVPKNLTAYDYDDEWGNTPQGYTGGGVCVINAGLCSDVGNFRVVFNATISGGTFNGQAITSVFSPNTNFTGGFVGWLGLDPSGISESAKYDVHNGTFSGTLAQISLGTTTVPETSTWAMMLIGFGGLGFAAYRTKKGANAAFAG
jgi:hypothetical protein